MLPTCGRMSSLSSDSFVAAWKKARATWTALHSSFAWLGIAAPANLIGLCVWLGVLRIRLHGPTVAPPSSSAAGAHHFCLPCPVPRSPLPAANLQAWRARGKVTWTQEAKCLLARRAAGAARLQHGRDPQSPCFPIHPPRWRKRNRRCPPRPRAVPRGRAEATASSALCPWVPPAAKCPGRKYGTYSRSDGSAWPRSPLQRRRHPRSSTRPPFTAQAQQDVAPLLWRYTMSLENCTNAPLALRPYL